MKKKTSPKIVLHKPSGAVAVLALAKVIASSVAANKVTFPTPNPTLVQFNTDISALDTAETAAKLRAKGAAQTRDAKLQAVVTDMDLMRSFVRAIADASDPANAEAIAHAAGMGIRKPSTATKSTFSAKPRKTLSGVILVTVKTGSVRAAHDWQSSIDGGKTWVDLPSTLQGKITASGFTPGQTVEFRQRALTKAGRSDWSQPISVMAH